MQLKRSSLWIGLLQMIFFSFSPAPTLSLFIYSSCYGLNASHKVIGFLHQPITKMRPQTTANVVLKACIKSSSTDRRETIEFEMCVRFITIHLCIYTQYLYRINVIDSTQSFSNEKQTKLKSKLNFNWKHGKHSNAVTIVQWHWCHTIASFSKHILILCFTQHIIYHVIWCFYS